MAESINTFLFKGLTLMVSAVIIFLLMLFFLYSAKPASADTGPYENLPPASIGNRNASLFLRIDPPLLLATANEANDKDVTMLFRLFDANTNQTIKFTTYFITVTKGISQNQPALLTDFFQAPDGLLAVKIHPSTDPVQVYGNREPYLDAAVADPGGNISVKGPVFREGGLYHFHIEIFGVDNPRNIFNATGGPKFDTYLNVGDVSTHKLQYNDQSYNCTLVSYFDRISDFKFNPAIKQISWSMPFDWNTTLLKSSTAFLHQEIRLPKSFKGLGDVGYFNASANGFPLTGRMLALDPYSFEDALTIHFLLNKIDLVSIGERVPKDTNNMTFSLIPLKNATLTTTTDMTTQTGGIRVTLDWKPSHLSAGNETELTLNFSDSAYGGSLNANVKYDLSITDMNGTAVILNKTAQLAVDGTDHQTVVFPKNEVYRININVQELDRPTQVPDWTRNGISRGIVVVPEFGSTLPLIAGAALACVIIAVSYTRHELER